MSLDRPKSASNITVLALLVILFFSEVTTIMSTAGLQDLRRLFNIVILLLFIVLSVAYLWIFLRQRMHSFVFVYIFTAYILVFSHSLNIIISGSLALSAILFPLFAMTSVPFIKSIDVKKVWKTYFYTVLITTIISLLEYFLVAAGKISLTNVDVGSATYLNAYISVFAEVDGVPHDRLYGPFGEPGKYAMFLLPAFSYAIFFRKIFSLLVLLVALYLIDSPGGYFGLIMIFIGSIYINIKKTMTIGSMTMFVVMVIGAILLSMIFLGGFVKRLDTHSFLYRETIIKYFIDNPLTHIERFFLGADLSSTDILHDLSADGGAVGFGFYPLNALIYGGVLGLIGAVLLIGICIHALIRYKAAVATGTNTNMTDCIFISLISMMAFVVQRQCLFELTLFSFLYARPILLMGIYKPPPKSVHA